MFVIVRVRLAAVCCGSLWGNVVLCAHHGAHAPRLLAPNWVDDAARLRHCLQWARGA